MNVKGLICGSFFAPQGEKRPTTDEKYVVSVHSIWQQIGAHLHPTSMCYQIATFVAHYTLVLFVKEWYKCARIDS